MFNALLFAASVSLAIPRHGTESALLAIPLVILALRRRAAHVT